MVFEIGLSKEEMNCFYPNVGMMGYGQPKNVIKEKGTPLYVRTIIIKKDHSLFIHAHLELAFISMALREEVLSRLRDEEIFLILKDDSLLLTAQHTHSGPGGFSHYPFYNFTIPNFQIKVFESLVEAIIISIKNALSDLRPSKLIYGEANLSPDADLASNRSLKAYLNNPEVSSQTKKEEAVNLKMSGIKILGLDGELRGFLNWFGVHCTSISSDNTKMHSDNKGISADLFEKKHPGAIALFLQCAAGDISPNYIWDKKIKRTRGKYPDQFESCQLNGELQSRASETIHFTKEIAGEIRSLFGHVDFPQFASYPAHGLAFFKGTSEGPGISKPLELLTRIFTFNYKIKSEQKSQKNKIFFASHMPKEIALDHRNGHFFGLSPEFFKKLPPTGDRTIDQFVKNLKSNSLNTLPWVPYILPFHIIQLGEILIVTIPGEITTQAAKRLENALIELNIISIKKILITSYANGYMGYITTPEEYDIQAYEGGHTIYGRRTLDAFILIVTQLTLKLHNMNHHEIPLVKSFSFPNDELEKRSQR